MPLTQIHPWVEIHWKQVTPVHLWGRLTLMQHHLQCLFPWRARTEAGLQGHSEGQQLGVIIETQHGLAWKGPLKITQSQPCHVQGHPSPAQAAESPIP